jgi:hypothetical protein
MPLQRDTAQPEPGDQLLQQHWRLHHAVRFTQQYQASPPQRFPEGGLGVGVDLQSQRRGIEGLHCRGQRLNRVDSRHFLRRCLGWR